MTTRRNHLALLLSLLAFEGILISDPVRPWLPFSVWNFDATALSLAGCLAFAGLALVGGFLPFTFPGLSPLPSTFPLIAAALILYGLPMAAALAIATALVAAFRPPQMSDADVRIDLARLPSLLAGMGLGLLIADLAGYAIPGEPQQRGSFNFAETLTTCSVLASGGILAALVARYLEERGTAGSRAPIALAPTAASAAVSAALALAAAQAVRIWGLGPVSLWLVPPFAVAAPLAAAMARTRAHSRSAFERADGAIEIIEALALAIEAKDRTSARHLKRMRRLAAGVGRRLGMSAADLADLDLAALLHDIGKIAVPEWILSKPGRLTLEEYQKMTVHSQTGAGILEAVPFARHVAPLVRHHHEHYDGTGYPSGLSGLEIPLGARILAVVDAADSITSERSYRMAVDREAAFQFIEEKAGTLFDPRVVKVLIESYDLLAGDDAAGRDAVTAGGATAAPVEADAAADPTAEPTRPMQTVLDTIASSSMEIYSLHEIGQALGKALNVEESLALIAGRLGSLFHYSACAIFVLDREHGVLVPRLTAGTGADQLRTLEIPLGVGPSGWAAMERRTLVGAPPPDAGIRHGARTDLEAIKDRPEIAALTSCVVAPLMAESELIGVLTLYDTESNPYAADEERLLAMVGRQVGQAVRNGLLFERTQEATLTDALTGLPNTRYMFVAMEHEVTRARDTGMLLSVLVMDIDRFARVNEEFGHPAGDRYLIGVSKLIRTVLRDHDTCVRYSGDEFVAILPNVGREEAMQIGERIKKAVDEFGVDGRGGRRVKTTISIGHATYSLDGEAFESMILAADERLAAEKTERRSKDLSGASLLPFRRPRHSSNN
ncbi:MAG: diguanylate cyclase [Acidobacteria bacterium]|nr:diguanylate cyclase [Acidobacteriota bacterium]